MLSSQKSYSRGDTLAEKDIFRISYGKIVIPETNFSIFNRIFYPFIWKLSSATFTDLETYLENTLQH